MFMLNTENSMFDKIISSQTRHLLAFQLHLTVFSSEWSWLRCHPVAYDVDSKRCCQKNLAFLGKCLWNLAILVQCKAATNGGRNVYIVTMDSCGWNKTVYTTTIILSLQLKLLQHSLLISLLRKRYIARGEDIEWSYRGKAGRNMSQD